MDYLRACDIHIYAYESFNTGTSGSIRFAMASYRPIVATNISIFKDFYNFMVLIDNNYSLMNSPSLLFRLSMLSSPHLFL